MNECAKIRTYITTNNIFSNYKSLITNPSYSKYIPPDVEPTPSYVILDSDAFHTYLSIATHYINIQPCISKHEVSSLNNIIMTVSHTALLDLPWFPLVGLNTTDDSWTIHV